MNADDVTIHGKRADVQSYCTTNTFLHQNCSYFRRTGSCVMFDNPRVVVSVCVSHPHHIGSLSSSPIDVKPANVSQFCVAMRIELAAAFGEERRGWVIEERK